MSKAAAEPRQQPASRLVRHFSSQDDKVALVRRYTARGAQGAVFAGEALDFLCSVPDGTADIVFLDPPFNLGKNYCDSRPRLDRKMPAEYGQWLFSVLRESARVTASGGSIYLYHLPVWAMRAGVEMERLGLDLRHWIAVSMKGTFARGRRLYPAHYALLFFTKGPPKHFQRPRIAPSTCRHCGHYIRDYGGYRSIIDKKGVNLSDFWDDLSPVRHANHKHRPANELPKILFERLIAISGAPGVLYVDPFAGSGTGTLCAAAAGLTFLVSDLVHSNCNIVCSRLDAHFGQ